MLGTNIPSSKTSKNQNSLFLPIILTTNIHVNEKITHIDKAPNIKVVSILKIIGHHTTIMELNIHCYNKMNIHFSKLLCPWSVLFLTNIMQT